MARMMLMTSAMVNTANADQGLLQAFKQAWDKIDNDEERQTLRNDELLGSLKEVVSQRVSQQRSESVIFQRRQLSLLNRRQTLLSVPATYQGASLADGERITTRFCQRMMESFLRQESLHYKFAAIIVEEMLALLKTIKPLQKITIPPGARIVVVGDTHGQFSDLVTAIKLGGWPSEFNYYLFNGDLVDRGEMDCEVLFMAYAMKLAMPNYVFINRGNHELRRMNEKYGFLDHVLDKYDEELYEKIIDTFQWLPVAAVIQEKVLVVHGGLFQYSDVTLAELEQLDMHGVRGVDIPRRNHLTHRAQFLVENIMWSDPEPQIEGWEESVRGAGILFGKEHTKAFLELNKLDCVVRSHQMVDAGHEELWGGLLHTVFSASYYGDANENKGAILVFTHDQKDYRRPAEVKSYHAENMVKDPKERQREQMENTLERLYERIFENRHALRLAYAAKSNERGVVPLTQWGRILRDITKLDIQWNAFLPYLAKIEEGGGINYSKFLTQFQICAVENDVGASLQSFQQEIIIAVSEKLNAHFANLQDAFKQLDADGSGSLSYDELVKALHKLDLGLTLDQMQDLMVSLDTNLDGSIDYNEFKHRFSHALNRGKAGDEVRRLVSRIQHQIIEKFGKGGKGIKDAFRAFDTDVNKRITYSEFTNVLKKDFNGEEWTNSEQRRAIFNYLDDNKSGSISYSEFKHAFDQREDKRDEAVQGAMMQKIFEAVRRARVQLRSAWRSLDKDNSKRIDDLEFRQGLDAMNSLLDSPITRVQLELLLKATPRDANGLVKYEEFLDSFQVRKIDLETLVKKVHSSGK